MTFKKFPCLAVFALLLFSFPSAAHAQGGSCHDPWINQAYNKDFHRAPSGSGTSGECNPNLYGGGSWPNDAVLSDLVLHSKDCSDPWIGQIYSALYSRRPSGAECSASSYGGSWSSYNDLTSKIQGYQARARAGVPPAAASRPSSSPAAATRGGGLISQDGGGLISQDGGGAFNRNGAGLVGPSGGTLANHNGGSIVAAGAGNIVAAGAGNIVSAGAGNMVNSRTVQSVDKPRAPAGKYLVIPGGALVDSNGNVVHAAGSYKLVYAAGVYRVGTGAAARAASPGMVVAP